MAEMNRMWNIKVYLDMDKVVPHHVLTDEEDIKKTVYKDIKLYLPK